MKGKKQEQQGNLEEKKGGEEVDENVENGQQKQEEGRGGWMAIGLFHLARFEAEAKGTAERDPDEEEMTRVLGKAGYEDLRRRKAMWSLLRAIHCFHERHTTLTARCYREGALYADQLAASSSSEEAGQMAIQLRNICARLLYQQKSSLK